MSRRKDRERASQFIFRDGVKRPRRLWDKHQKELKEMEEAQRLAKIGLVKGKANMLIPKEITKERKPIK